MAYRTDRGNLDLHNRKKLLDDQSVRHSENRRPLGEIVEVIHRPLQRDYEQTADVPLVRGPCEDGVPVPSVQEIKGFGAMHPLKGVAVEGGRVETEVTQKTDRMELQGVVQFPRALELYPMPEDLMQQRNVVVPANALNVLGHCGNVRHHALKFLQLGKVGAGAGNRFDGATITRLLFSKMQRDSIMDQPPRARIIGHDRQPSRPKAFAHRL